ncbi:MAG: hypothetical protein ABW223_01800, partial [Rariglobus sp.]
MKNRLPLLGTALLLSALPSLVSAQDATREPDVTVPAPAVNPWRIDASANYSRGDYGLTEDTEVYVGLLNIVYETKSWRFQTGVPVLHIEGPATIVGGGA